LRRAAARVLLLPLLAVVAFWATTVPADAHAIVRETRPGVDQVVAASPTEVVMRFNEPVELAFGALRVYDTRGQRVDDGDAAHAGRDAIRVALDPGLPDGTYTVTWQVVSADGHAIREAFVFHVGAPGERPEGIADELLAGESGAGRAESVAAGVARWALFLGLVLLGGALAFPLLVASDAAGDRRRERLVVVGWVAAVAGTAAGFVLQGAVAAGVSVGSALSPDVLADVAGTRYGRFSAARLVLLAVVAVLAHRVPRAAVAAAVVAMATVGAAGHAGTTSPVALHLALDVVHMAAAAAWLGGLAVLVRCRRFEAEVVSRFSVVATASVSALVVTGLVRSWAEVGGLDALGEPYGLVLLSKVGLFLVMLVLGWANRRTLGEDRTRLRRRVAAEVAIGVAVLALTAVLVSQAPARVSQGGSGPFEATVALGDYRLYVVVDPRRVGENAVHLTAATATGAPAPVESMQVLFTLPAEGVGPLVADAVRLGPGHFTVQGRQLSLRGRWTLEVVAATGRFEERRARVVVPVNR
jgi:copper transport protein